MVISCHWRVYLQTTFRGIHEIIRQKSAISPSPEAMQRMTSICLIGLVCKSDFIATFISLGLQIYPPNEQEITIADKFCMASAVVITLPIPILL